jgi:hypothetical protein
VHLVSHANLFEVQAANPPRRFRAVDALMLPTRFAQFVPLPAAGAAGSML